MTPFGILEHGHEDDDQECGSSHPLKPGFLVFEHVRLGEIVLAHGRTRHQRAAAQSEKNRQQP